MPFCESCGERLEDDDDFCSECGARVGGSLDELTMHSGGGVRRHFPAAGTVTACPVAGGPRQRHIALAIYLWFLIAANTLVTIWYIYWLIQLGRLAEALGVSLFGSWVPVVVLLLTFAYAVDIVAPIALMKWKRWGFWYFSVLVAVAFVFNLANHNFLGGLLNLVGWGILFGLLQVGSEKRAWPQLE
jgi:hypothetical protein